MAESWREQGNRKDTKDGLPQCRVSSVTGPQGLQAVPFSHASPPFSDVLRLLSAPTHTGSREAKRHWRQLKLKSRKYEQVTPPPPVTVTTT